MTHLLPLLVGTALTAGGYTLLAAIASFIENNREDER